MTSNYNIFFSIDLFHEYYVNRTCNDFDTVPTRDSVELAKQLNIQWRKKSNGLVAIILANDQQEPFINVPPEKHYGRYYERAVLRFYLKLNNPYFLNYTNAAQAYARNTKYYFSNLANNEAHYLTAPVPDYANGKVYVPGDLVRDSTSGAIYEALEKHTPKKKAQLQDALLWAPKGQQHSSETIDGFEVGKKYTTGDLVKDPADGQVYEAVGKHTAGSAEELSNPALWYAKGSGHLQYPTDNDLVEYCGATYICKLPAAVLKADVAVSGFNFDNDSPAYDVPVFQTGMQFETPVAKIPVNPGSLPPGRYRVQVNKESRTVYFDPLLNDTNAWGVIEIFNHLPVTNPYSLLTDEEKIKQVRYQVHFANCRVLWKYTRKDGRADRITDTADNGYEFNLHGDDFVSATPMPLTENTLKTLKLEFSTKDFGVYPLPNPQVNRLVRYTQDDYDYLCSEVVLNY